MMTAQWQVKVLGVLAVVGLWVGVMPAQAKTYYVSQSGGNDSAAGTAESSAWKTLGKASGVQLAPGDSILLKCGDTWNEELAPKGNGTPQAPILISSYGKGAKPIIDRQDDKQDLVGLLLKDQEGFKIVGLEFAKCMTGIYAEYSAGCPTKKYLWIENCYFRDSKTYGHYETYPKPRNISLGVCLFSYERGKKIVLQDIMVKNCEFRRLASAFWTNSPDNFNKNASFVYNFKNLVFEDCLFEEGLQWQQGIRGVDGGAMRNCVTHDVGRNNLAWNGVAGAMFFRCKDWVIEDCEWGFVDIGGGSGDGEAFDWEGNCNDSVMKNCSFHDTDGPGFLLCCYASDGNPNKGIVMENCFINAKSKRPIRPRVRAAIINTTDWTDATWKKCRFYLSPGEGLMAVMDGEKDKHSKFIDCVQKPLPEACPAAQAVKGTLKASGNEWTLTFAAPVTINSFKIKEGPNSSINRYKIEYWDEKAKKWANGFNGMAIGAEFVAPIVARTTKSVKLTAMKTNSGAPAISEFTAYNDTQGWQPVPEKGGR